MTRVQTTYTAVNGSAPGTSITTPSLTTTAGNLLVVVIRWDGATSLLSVDDGGSNTYSLVDGVAGRNPTIVMYYVPNLVSFSQGVTATFVGNPNYSWIYVAEYAGATTSPLDTSETGASTGTTDLTTDTGFTTTTAGLIFLGASQNNFATYSAGTDFTLVEGAITGGGGQNYGGIEEYLTSGTVSSYTAHITSTVTNDYSLVVGAFKATTGTKLILIPGR